MHRVTAIRVALAVAAVVATAACGKESAQKGASQAQPGDRPAMPPPPAEYTVVL